MTDVTLRGTRRRAPRRSRIERRHRVIGEAEPLLGHLRERSRYERYAKPAVDRLAGLVLFLGLLPLTALVALVVLMDLGRPVFLRQQRVGIGGRLFRMYKFRTMEPDRRRGREDFHGPERRVCHKSEHDPRHTALGRVLRRWSLDELPQLWNVVAGHMSLVGPRPELVELVRAYEPWQHRRHSVKPGLTGLWQITERGNGSLMHEHIDIDLRYVDGVSFADDLKIMLRTVPAVLGDRRGS